MLKCLIVIGLYVGMTALTPVMGQDSTLSGLPSKWTLQDCLDYALKNNITVNTLRLSERSAQQDLLQSKAAVQPNLTGSVSEYLAFQRGTDASGNYVGRKGRLSGSYGLNSSVTLFNGGYLRNDIRLKQLSLKSAGLSVLETENDITLELTQDFLNILLAKENIVYLQDLLTTAQAQVVQAQQRYDAGSIALKDLAELQAQAANDKYTLIEAENTHRQNVITLKQLLQLPSEVTFAVSEPDSLMAKGLLPNLREVQQQALAIRPEVKIGQLNLQISQLDLQLARAGLLPTLSASGAIGSSHAGGTDYNYVQQLDNNFYQQIGLTLSIPIFNRRSVRTSIEKAKIEIEQSQLDLKNTTNSLSLTVEQAYINVVNAQGLYDASVEQLRYTEESYRIANEQLKVGVSNTVEFLQQKNLYVQAMQSYLQAKYSAALTIRIYDFYRGVPIKL